MVDRIVLGLHGGAWKARISRPGIDVHSASGEQFLLHETQKQLQILQTGIVTRPGTQAGNVVVAIPNYGFVPVVLAWPVGGNGYLYQFWAATDTPVRNNYVSNLQINLGQTSFEVVIPHWAPYARYAVTSVKAQ